MPESSPPVPSAEGPKAPGAPEHAPAQVPGAYSSDSAHATYSGVTAAPGGVDSVGTPAWAETMSNLVITTVGSVKEKATVKVVVILRVLIYGLVIAVASVTALLLLLIGVVRIWDVYIPLSPVGRRVWLGYVVFGALFFLAGAWLLSSSRKRARE